MPGSNVTPRINHNRIESPTLNAHLCSESVHAASATCGQLTYPDGPSAAPFLVSKTAKVHTTYGGVAISDSLSSLRRDK